MKKITVSEDVYNVLVSLEKEGWTKQEIFNMRNNKMLDTSANCLYEVKNFDFAEMMVIGYEKND